MPATKPPWRSPPRDQDQDPEQGPPGDDDTPDSPPLLLDRSVDISATVLSLLLLGSSIHPVAQTVPPVLFDAKPSRMREIALTQTIRRNQRMLLLAGKLPVRRCVVHCGAVNSLDHWRRP